ncbi:MAG TPA: HNH endonuclease, partial [Lapillicoccus sp.]|nr:HNH endonuclease [Lapillicoccus sp.]
RRHHNHKTRGVWTAEAEDGGGIVWRTASGRRYRTDRHDYDDPLGRPVTDTEIELALAEDPPPF